MKQYFTTDDLRRALHITSFYLGVQGLEIDYTVEGHPRSLTAPPYYASTLLVDTGFLESREAINGDRDDLWVEESTEGLDGQERPLWKTWEQFIVDGAKLSQWWALELVIRHEDNQQLKMVGWEIGRDMIDPKKN